MTKHKVRLHPSEKTVEVSEGENLLEALRKEGVYIRSSCGGVASCSDCIVKVEFGEDHLEAPNFEELKLLGNVFHITKERLACQTCITGDVTLDMSRHDKSKDENERSQKTRKFIKHKLRKQSDIPVKTEDQLTKDAPVAKKQGGFRRPKRKK